MRIKLKATLEEFIAGLQSISTDLAISATDTEIDITMRDGSEPNDTLKNALKAKAKEVKEDVTV